MPCPLPSCLKLLHGALPKWSGVDWAERDVNCKHEAEKKIIDSGLGNKSKDLDAYHNIRSEMRRQWRPKLRGLEAWTVFS